MSRETPGDEWAGELAAYCATLATAPTTARIRATRLRRMALDLGGEPYAVTRPQLATWLDALPGTPATVKEYRTAARAFYRWALGEGKIGSDPMPPKPPVSRYRLDVQWRDALDLFTVAQRRARIASSTIDLRCKHLVRFAGECGRSPWQVEREHLIGWLEGAPVSDSTRAALRVSLRAFYRWAYRSGRIAEDPSEEPSQRLQRLGAPEKWADPLRAFRSYMRAAGHPETTVRLRIAHLERFARDHARLDPFAASLDDLIDWLDGRRWSVEYRRSIRSSLRAFYLWAEETGRIDGSPAERLPVVKASQPAPRPAPESDYRHALAASTPRERLALRLAAELGMRRAEVASIHTRDLTCDGGSWALTVRGKGGRIRNLPLTDDLARAIRTRPAGYLFPGQDHGHLSARYLGKIISALLPPGVTMHALRHRFATLAYSVDRDVFTVQQLLGHASPATTQRYVQVSSDRKRRLVEAVGQSVAV